MTPWSQTSFQLAVRKKSRYNATHLAGSAIVQEYRVMIQERLEYLYLTTGLWNVLLRVLSDDPGALYYDLGQPNLDVEANIAGFCRPKTEVERRGKQLPIWETIFSLIRIQIPEDELRQNPPKLWLRF
ncbi:hypothetical protein PAAG_03344 [Paracoccidioides lutzii Pb01]|uniref:Uncharacterized protein n=1 Tax=Paracoccidioides lutzii (strain ATCC MYA-826 / Pb01) TaxID=502779 RepID=C1GWX0_PARBA|nr:hypothetical protein PAAG_03344 [Paracoccidioides lutzii Pb01]EEH41058.2 hypothetical protein PAAG_03344 [Paracoccidioides lutzii Pb01]